MIKAEVFGLQIWILRSMLQSWLLIDSRECNRPLVGQLWIALVYFTIFGNTESVHRILWMRHSESGRKGSNILTKSRLLKSPLFSNVTWFKCKFLIRNLHNLFVRRDGLIYFILFRNIFSLKIVNLFLLCVYEYRTFTDPKRNLCKPKQKLR